MRRSDLAAAGAVLLAGALVLLGQGRPSQPAGPAAARSVPVAQTTLVCPATDAAHAPETAVAAVGSTPLAKPPRLPPAPIRITAGRRRLAEIDARGVTWSSDAAAVTQGLEASTGGALAAGLSAGLATVHDGDRRGLASTSCPEPASHWWFVGAASTSERSAVLQLANPNTGVAVVDLTFYGPRGAIEPAGAQGLAVAPGQRRSVPLNNLVPGVDAVAVEVTSRQGRVAAVLSETARDVLEPAGVDTVPAAAEPRRTTALTGIPAGPGRHTLSVVNAGAGAAVVRVEVLGREGAFTPTAVEQLRVPARAVGETPVPARVLDGAASGIRLRSDQPVTAAVRTSAGAPLADQSFAVSGEPVGPLAAMPVLSGLQGELVLSGTGDSTVAVDVSMFGADGRRRDRRTLEVRAGQTRTVALTHASAASVQVRARGAGSVLAAVQWSTADDDGRLVSAHPLAPLRLRVDRPAVRYEPVP